MNDEQAALPVSSNNWEQIRQQLPGFDFGEFVVADPDCLLYPELLTSFVADIEPYYDEALELLASSAIVDAQRKVHYMKGAAGTLGARELLQCCQNLDAELKAGGFQEPTLRAWQLSYQATMALIRTVVEGQGAVRPVEKGSVDSAMDALAEISTRLAGSEFVDEALLNEVEAGVAEQCKEEARQLRQAVTALDYDVARASVVRLQAEGCHVC